MKILIGIDGSDCSRAAVEFVRRLTWPAGTRVLVASAVQPMVLAYTELYVTPASEELLQEERKSCEERVSLAEHDLRDAGLGTESRVLEGDPRETLVQLAKAEKVDLVVVGSHGRSGLAKFFLGSVASHVVTHAPCSVMVVKSGPRGD
jgi:nucleotide-binding universal stress UspA family protein